MSRICCVARAGSRMAQTGKHFSVPIWTGAIYEARSRTRDGALTWRRVGSYGRSAAGYRPSQRLISELRATAPHPFSDVAVRHGQCVIL